MDTTTRGYETYNRLQAWLGSERTMTAPGQFVTDEDLNELAQKAGYLNWSDYKDAEALMAEDREAEKGQY